jgi:hypothetical protein
LLLFFTYTIGDNGELGGNSVEISNAGCDWSSDIALVNSGGID